MWTVRLVIASQMGEGRRVVACSDYSTISFLVATPWGGGMAGRGEPGVQPEGGELVVNFNLLPSKNVLNL